MAIKELIGQYQGTSFLLGTAQLSITTLQCEYNGDHCIEITALTPRKQRVLVYWDEIFFSVPDWKNPRETLEQNSYNINSANRKAFVLLSQFNWTGK